MTGFRVGLGGVQAREGVLPDLTTLGKVIGGGLPVGAFGGRADILDRLTPDGDIFQAGTLSGNPLAMAAGIATLRELSEATYAHLEALGRRLTGGMAQVFARRGVPHSVAAAGSMMGFFFTDGPVTDLTSAKTADVALYGRFFHAMLERGFYFAPAQFEAGFLSLAHGEAEIDAHRRGGRRRAGGDPRVPLVCLGLSHNTAPVDVRERHAFPPHKMGEALIALRDYEAVREALMLQTCGRLEIYAELEDYESGVTQLKAFLNNFRHGDVSDMESYMYTLLGDAGHRPPVPGQHRASTRC